MRGASVKRKGIRNIRTEKGEKDMKKMQELIAKNETQYHSVSGMQPFRAQIAWESQ